VAYQEFLHRWRDGLIHNRPGGLQDSAMDAQKMREDMVDEGNSILGSVP